MHDWLMAVDAGILFTGFCEQATSVNRIRRVLFISYLSAT